ncbi:MAG: GNAT family N-acetyltransferase [Pseudomonadota bacterium]
MSLNACRHADFRDDQKEPSVEPLTDIHIRKIMASETQAFCEHLLRLDPDNRRMRFAHAVSDSFIRDYADRMCDLGSIIYGGFDTKGALRAAAELRKLGPDWNRSAETAFSVETPYQARGLGTLLMGRVIRAARNRGVQHLYMSCLAENAPMQTIAKKHSASLRFEYGEVVGDIIPEHADLFSQFGEAVEDRVGFLLAVIDLDRRRKGQIENAQETGAKLRH